MKRHCLRIFVLTLLLFGLTGCYTQLQVVDRSNSDRYYSDYAEEEAEYYEDDSLDYEYDPVINNIYIGSGYGYRYGYSQWDDPWMWDNWGYFSGLYFSDYDYYYRYTPNYWWHRSMYPFVTAYPYWGHYGHHGWWGGHNYGKYTQSKRPFNRRSQTYGGRIVRTGGEKRSVSNAVSSKRLIRRDAANNVNRRSGTAISNKRSLKRKSAVKSGPKTRTSRPKYRIKRSDRNSKSTEKSYRSKKSKSSDSKSSGKYRSSKKSSSSRPSYRKSSSGSSNRSSGSRSKSSSRSGSSRSSSSSSSSSRSSNRR